MFEVPIEADLRKPPLPINVYLSLENTTHLGLRNQNVHSSSRVIIIQQMMAMTSVDKKWGKIVRYG